MTIKALIKQIPGAVSVVRTVRRWAASPDAFDSARYWEERYRTGGNSGPGSYNRLAEFKANFINQFVARNEIRSVIEFGCGDGAQLELMDYPDYIGVDVSHTILDRTAARFAEDATKRFLHSDAVTASHQAELSLSLDVIYHLIEDSVFIAYMQHLFDASTRFVIIYSNDIEVPWGMTHERYRKFSQWVEQNRPEFSLTQIEKNPFPADPKDPANTSMADFFVYKRL